MLNEERDRTLGLVPHPVFGVGGEEDLRLGLFALRFLLAIGCLLFQHHRPGDDGILSSLPVDAERVFALDQVVDRGGFFFFLLFFLVIGLPWVLRAWGCSWIEFLWLYKRFWKSVACK